MSLYNVGVAVGGVLIVISLLLILSGLAAAAVSRKAAQRGRQVIRVRRQWMRRYFVENLTFLALIYRVTSLSEDGGKAMVRLYAYDVGQVFSRRHSMVRQLSGGVWRDA
jgi:hypothetical protein